MGLFSFAKRSKKAVPPTKKAMGKATPAKTEATPAKSKAPCPKPAPPSPKSYEAIEKAIVLSRDWMSHTSMATALRVFDAAFTASASLKTACEQEAQEIVKLLCAKGRSPNAANCLNGLVNAPAGGKKVDIALGFLLLLKYSSPDGARALIEQIQDRAQRCESARRQAYSVLIQSAAAALACPVEVSRTKWDRQLPPALLSSTRDASDAVAASASPLALVASSSSSAAAQACLGDPAALAALNRLLECVEHYLDSHKLNAFKTALQEPARLWYHLIGHSHHRDHVNVHGLNGYLCIVRGGLGCQLPLLPLESDGDTFKGCGDHWKGLSDAAWAAFADPSNFGKDMEAVLSKGTHGFLASKANNDGWCGPNARALEERAKKGETTLLPYVARFGFFFSGEFLTTRMFETLNGENDPSLAGFRKACDQLWPLYARDRCISQGGPADDVTETSDDAASSHSSDEGHYAAPAASSLVEHVYDEYFTTLDTSRVSDFMRWVGVYKEE